MAALSPSIASTGLHALDLTLHMQPSLVLSFYPFGILMRKQEEDRVTEYPIDPAHLASALALPVQYSTGILTPDTIYVGFNGMKKLVVGYRPPQKTALFLDGTETPLRVPFPGLLLARTTFNDERPRYAVYAVTKRPDSPETPLFLAPMPNTGHDSVCWGSVAKVSPSALAANDLREDWSVLLGSLFTSHSVAGKSKSHPNDIRAKLLDLEQRKVKRYHLRDLVRTKFTIADLIRQLEDPQ